MAAVTSRALDLATPSTRGNSFITDISATFLLDGDPWLPTAAWVRMLVALDLPSATARTSLHRMDKGGYLDRASRDGRPGYAMSDGWRDFVHAATADDDEDVERQTRWTLVTFSIPEAQRELRHPLRTLLERLGLASLGNGIWIGPEVVAPTVRKLVSESGLSSYVDYFLAEYGGFLADSATLARRCWDLDAAQRELTSFDQAVRGELTRSAVGGQDAFATAMTFSNTWRRLTSAVPALPSRLFPPGVSRPTARATLDELLAVRLPEARAWVEALRAVGAATS